MGKRPESKLRCLGEREGVSVWLCGRVAGEWLEPGGGVAAQSGVNCLVDLPCIQVSADPHQVGTHFGAPSLLSSRGSEGFSDNRLDKPFKSH